MNANELLARLGSSEVRKASILVLGGTGISMWTYYPFLRHFSLSELAEFSAIYGISGGAACLWYYGLQQIGLFEDTHIVDYEPAIRTLNNGTVCGRLWGLMRNSYIYETQRLADGIEKLASPKGRHLTFSEFPLANFTAAAHDYINHRLILLNRTATPTLSMGDAMASVSAPRVLFGRRFSRPIRFAKFGISDLDFAGAALRGQFKALVKAEDRPIYWLNIYFSADKDHVTYVKLSRDRWPRAGQLYDMLMFFCGIPNTRLYSASVG